VHRRVNGTKSMAHQIGRNARLADRSGPQRRIRTAETPHPLVPALSDPRSRGLGELSGTWPDGSPAAMSSSRSS